MPDLESVNLLHGHEVPTLSQQVRAEAASIESRITYCQAAAQEGEQAAIRRRALIPRAALVR
jgi:hypothetical protein